MFKCGWLSRPYCLRRIAVEAMPFDNQEMVVEAIMVDDYDNLDDCLSINGFCGTVGNCG